MNDRLEYRRSLGLPKADEPTLTIVPLDLYYHEVEYVRGLEIALRSIELDVDGLNTKGYKQQKNTQDALGRIKAKCRAALTS